MTQWLNLEPETTPSSKTVNRAESMRLKFETDFKADEEYIGRLERLEYIGTWEKSKF